MNTALDLHQKIKRMHRYPSLFRSSLFDDFFAGLDDVSALIQKGNTPCDILEVKDEYGNTTSYEFFYALAGYSKENVNIEINDNELIISVDKNEDLLEPNKSYLYRGLSRKAQQWSYVLNSTIDAKNVAASMDNGILKVIVPYVAQKQTHKKIEIK